MLETILSFCLKYWIELLLSAIVGGVSIFFRRYLAMLQAEREQKHEAFKKYLKDDLNLTMNKVLEKSEADDAILQENINGLSSEIGCLKTGILSIQGSQFKDFCRELLKENHVITVEEFEEMEEEHDVYKNLGGNHNGDQLYSLVVAKMQHNV